MFNFLKEKVKKIYNSFTTKASSLFSRAKLDEDLLKELETLLIASDTGVQTTRRIMAELKQKVAAHTIESVDQLKAALEALLQEQLRCATAPEAAPRILLLVGVNGTGKTTFAAKFAKHCRKQGRSVLLVAADTFRAAATEQLRSWGEKINVPVFIGRDDQDPASVIFDACQKFKDEQYDHLIIDTAGRLQTKVNLMRELEKIRKIINRQLPSEAIQTWLTVDAMIGQNSFQQAKVFHESTSLTGLVLTKLDGSGKGGIVFAITQELQVPIAYISFGEKVEDISPFEPAQYVRNLLGIG